MKKTLALLAASTALTAAIGLPSWSAIRDHEDGHDHTFAALDQEEAIPVVLASDDDDDRRHRRAARHDDDEDEDEDDDDKGGRGARNPAPAGTVAPPQNGLFGTGAPPQVRVN